MSFVLFDGQPLYLQNWFIVLMIVLGSILVAALLVLLVIFAAHQAVKRKVNDLANQYSTIHSSFDNDCRTMLKRVENISHYNATYVQIFDSDNARFNEIMEENDAPCAKTLEELKESLGRKEYKKVAEKAEKLRPKMDEYRAKAGDLTTELRNLLRPEDECNDLIVALREKFRSLKEKHDDHATELMTLDPSFKQLFDYIVGQFTEIDSALNAADYDRVKKIIPGAESLIKATDAVIGKIPYLNTLCDKVLPNRIQELKDAKAKMEADNYPLHDLNLNSAIAEMEEQLKACKSRLENLSIKGVQETCDSITSRINRFFEAFEKEKTSKEEFDSKQSEIDKEAYACEEEFSKIRAKLPEYMATYKIDKSYLDQLSKVKDLIDDMSKDKRQLDYFINSSTKLAYSALVEQMEALESKVASIKKAFYDFWNYLNNLRNDAERAYAFVRSSYVVLRKKESDLREAGVISLQTVETAKIQKAYGMIKDIDTLVRTAPINVPSVNYKWKEADDYILALSEEIRSNIEAMHRAENFIVYDNKFRRDSEQIQSELAIVENSFYEADFDRASNVASKIYQDAVANQGGQQ
jgi:septation ring formation regulator EzrA